MPYTLYTDKAENFICEVSVKNASLKNAFARMIVESDNFSLMFKGQIKDGKCTVPINRLRGLLDERSRGKMHLELIVEDTYFKPWEDDFIVEQNTAVKVNVQEQKRTSKPIVEIKTRPQIKTKLSIPASDIVFICGHIGITKKNLIKHEKDFKQLVREYFKSSPEFMSRSKIYIHEAVTALK